MQRLPPVRDHRRPIRETIHREELAFFLVQPLHAGQDVLFFGNAGESGFVEQHLGEDHGGHRVIDQRRVNRQLRLGNPRFGPIPGVDAGTGLVVDDHLPTVNQPVDAVDHHAHANALDLDFGRRFASQHLEGQSPRRLHRQPTRQQPLQTGGLQLPEAHRQGTAPLGLEGGQRGGNGGIDGSGSDGIIERRQRRRTADCPPEGLQRRVHQRAPGGRIEPFDRRIHRLGAQPELIKGPGRADGLCAQQPATACDPLAGRHRRRLGIIDGLQRPVERVRQNVCQGRLGIETGR